MMYATSGNITRVIACKAFQPALEHLQLERRYPNVRLTYLRSSLHIMPKELARCLREEFISAQKREERIICLYGDCVPDIDEVCQRHRAIKVPGVHCWEMLLGSQRFQALTDEMAGTYFVERDLILNFEEYCVEPLELHDEEMRRICFECYRRLLYVRQPTDPDLVPRARELAEFLGLSLEITDADYLHLERRLVPLL